MIELWVLIYSLDPPSKTDPVEDPQGQVPEPFAFNFSQVQPTQYSGGTAKIADSTTFKVASQVAVAEVTVEPGAMRELHVSIGIWALCGELKASF